MGFRYLNGKRWAQVTREERFFCQHLFGLLVEDRDNAAVCAGRLER